jgi:protein-disulfide isomerase
MKQIVDAYKGKVRWVYRHFPLNSIHPDAQKAAEAAECAAEQGKFWEMSDKMFEKQTLGLSVAQLSQYARESGVKDIAKFDSCVSSGKYASRVASDLAGGEAAGVTGTPGTIILTKDGKKQLIPGALPYDSVKQMIDSLLAS